MSYTYPEERVIEGWTIRRVRLDDAGRDANGWKFDHPGLPLYWVEKDGESLTVRAESMDAAVEKLTVENGWPPKLLRRFGWEYQTP